MESKEKVQDYKSLSGWLIVLQVFIILNGLSWVKNLQLFYGLLGEKDKIINEMYNSAPGLYLAFIYFEIAAGVTMLLFTIVLLYYMFRMAKIFKILMIAFVGLEILLEIAVYIFFGPLMQSSGLPIEKLFFTLTIAVLITYYILKSERVRQTFVR